MSSLKPQALSLEIASLCSHEPPKPQTLQEFLRIGGPEDPTVDTKNPA